MPVPRVSVVVPNYNHRAFLPERLESIWRQAFADFEVVLLDDASTDESVAVLRTYAERPNVRLFVNDANSRSPFHQWNRGVQEARGEYIWIAESDDAAQPELLETLVAVLDQHSSVGVAECDTQLITASGEVVGTVQRDAYPEATDRWRQNFLANGREEVRRFLYLQNTIPSASAVLFRRSVYLAAGPADSTLRLAGDWLQWVKLLLHCDRYFVAKAMNLSRLHSATQRESAACNGRSELEALSVQEQIRELVDLDRETIRRGAERYATSWLQGLRAGRYCGPLRGHAAVFRHLLASDPIIACRFAAHLPYSMGAWTLKNARRRRR